MMKYKDEQLKRVERMMRMTDLEFYKEYIVKIPEKEKKHTAMKSPEAGRKTV